MVRLDEKDIAGPSFLRAYGSLLKEALLSHRDGTLIREFRFTKSWDGSKGLRRRFPRFFSFVLNIYSYVCCFVFPNPPL